jgi:hypothetical protein
MENSTPLPLSIPSHKAMTAVPTVHQSPMPVVATEAQSPTKCTHHSLHHVGIDAPHVGMNPGKKKRTKKMDQSKHQVRLA